MLPPPHCICNWPSPCRKNNTQNAKKSVLWGAQAWGGGSLDLIFCPQISKKSSKIYALVKCNLSTFVSKVQAKYPAFSGTSSHVTRRPRQVPCHPLDYGHAHKKCNLSMPENVVAREFILTEDIMRRNETGTVSFQNCVLAYLNSITSQSWMCRKSLILTLYSCKQTMNIFIIFTWKTIMHVRC